MRLRIFVGSTGVQCVSRAQQGSGSPAAERVATTIEIDAPNTPYRGRARGGITVFALVSLLAACGPGYGAIVAGELASRAVASSVASARTSTFVFDSVTWARTTGDTNTFTVRGVMTWKKADAGTRNAPFLDLGPANPSQPWVAVELLDSLDRTIATVGGTLTVWEGQERVTMVADTIPVRFELRTPAISPNVARVVKDVRVKALAGRTG